jgi:transposase
MEEVLDLYAEPLDPTRPVVCFDERPCQLIEETRTPRPVAPGRAARVDYEYRRNGTANLFVAVQPRGGWRRVTATEHRTKVDFAEQLRQLVDVDFPTAERIRLVLDNLNTHTVGALYETFPAAEARRIARKLEFHYTPKHGSWLNMAELELSVLSRQGLDRRIPSFDQLQSEVDAWQAARNAAGATIDWHFTCEDARTKLPKLYPA